MVTRWIVMIDYRKECDSLGEIEVVINALYGANSYSKEYNFIIGFGTISFL